MMIQNVTSDRAPDPVGAFPHAKRVGEFLFLSGIGPRTRGHDGVPGVTLNTDGTIAAYDFEIQCRTVFDNVRSVIEDAGATWDDIVDVTVFLTDIGRDFAVYNRLYAEYFSSNKPTRTTVEVNRLPTPIAIELKVIAWTGKR